MSLVKERIDQFAMPCGGFEFCFRMVRVNIVLLEVVAPGGSTATSSQKVDPSDG